MVSCPERNSMNHRVISTDLLSSARYQRTLPCDAWPILRPQSLGATRQGSHVTASKRQGPSLANCGCAVCYTLGPPAPPPDSLILGVTIMIHDGQPDAIDLQSARQSKQTFQARSHSSSSSSSSCVILTMASSSNIGLSESFLTLVAYRDLPTFANDTST